MQQKQNSKGFETRLVYNRTSEMIRCYNSEGNFVELMPMGGTLLPEYELGIYYVVSDAEFKRIVDSGRTTKDLARILDQKPSKGRGEVEIVYLETWDRDDRGTTCRIVPCSTNSYERNDPKERIHHVLDV
ncbi:hypothetical protein IJ768_01890 [Candidatus Saccharibacteria bacterium]|nr:hypothetical protein [Candidatus Saccharibacteria bacterium]